MSDLGTIPGATGLESAINAIWADKAALAALVPADRLITGRVPPSEEMPYVRLEPDAGGNTQRTNASLYQTAKIAFHVWSDTFDAGRQVAAAVRDAFASMAFDWVTGAVLDMRWDGPPASRQTTDPEIKAWETVVIFTAATWLSRDDNSSSSSGT
jgi:hypothetical protein